MILDVMGNVPIRNYAYDGGLDLFCDEGLEIAGLVTLGRMGKMDELYRINGDVKTGTRVAIPGGYVGLVMDKSGLGKRRIKVFGGVIDSGYTGEIIVMVSNFGETTTIVRGDKIAQLLIVPIELPSVRLVEGFDETERGEKGFGSSGR